jgi:hypothetical protein
MDLIQFEGFPKMARLSREVVVTEKIDGTNAQVVVTEDGKVFAGSRKRWITPEDDNFGFAKWVKENEKSLIHLGVGRHFGEWWGAGIQRKYGMQNNNRKFSLFNVLRFGEGGSILPSCCDLVPVLYQGVFDTSKIDEVIEKLATEGSVAAPGFMDAEGIVVYHIAGNVGFKKTIKNDEKPKSLVK